MDEVSKGVAEPDILTSGQVSLSYVSSTALINPTQATIASPIIKCEIVIHIYRFDGTIACVGNYISKSAKLISRLKFTDMSLRT